MFGATSLVGQCLLPMLRQSGWKVRAYSRRTMASDDPGIQWVQLASSGDCPGNPQDNGGEIPFWICVASIWVLPDYFSLLEKFGARRVIAISSTSRFTKTNSTSPEEQTVAEKLMNAEERLTNWARARNIDFVILRPTLIYGLGQDKNISRILRLIRRFGFFPLLGPANGLRQPIHAEDVATACRSVLEKADIINQAYNLSGGETLDYRDMVCRVFAAAGRRPKFICVPPRIFNLAVAVLRLFPRYRHLTIQMAERMNTDLIFDHTAAARDFNFCPRRFHLDSKDIPG